MKLNISICTKENCKVFVKDETLVSYNEGYLPETSQSVALNRFRYSDTGAIEVIFLERYNETKSGVKESKYIQHTDKNKDEGYEIPIRFDGVFTIYSIVIPTVDWFMHNAENNPSLVELYDAIYTVDYDGKAVYKMTKKLVPLEEGETSIWSSWNKEAVEIEELIERNPEGTTISRTCDTYVSICYLLHCYLSLCQAIFEGQGFSGSNGNMACFNRSNVDDGLIYRRDMVWMALNTIHYLVEANRLQEAQRIIEQIGGCNGLCKGWYEHSGLKPDCGCGQSRSRGFSDCGCK